MISIITAQIEILNNFFASGATTAHKTAPMRAFWILQNRRIELERKYEFSRKHANYTLK